MCKYLLFDTESTGLQEKDRLIQVGSMLVEHGKETIITDEVVGTHEPISFSSMEIHGITPEKLEGAAPFSETVFKRVLDIHNDPKNYLIAHNISFDLGMLEKEGFKNQYTLIDTLRVSRHIFNEDINRLQYLRYALGLYHKEEQESWDLGIEIKAHDAISDVLIMKLLFSKIIQTVKELYPETNAIAKIVELTNTPILVEKFKFGKYKGKLISEVAQSDKGYLSWMRGNLEVDEDMQHTITHYIGACEYAH
ncbi:MAG: Exodeoxyribonuclease X [uncultured Sulfurovum sp.]|uniref:Exodeoxyribonuclease X n=1 Tax=uncultured Sulfurovum sp. TaxID=269237 RepID=A0A6S6SKQ4_9BACT|nr:MAG: Exodeoxyribonuclease X [uncultured Sulfurovum sp.]